MKQFDANDTVKFLFYEQCTSLQIKILEQEEDLAIQRKQQQDSTEQVQRVRKECLWWVDTLNCKTLNYELNKSCPPYHLIFNFLFPSTLFKFIDFTAA